MRHFDIKNRNGYTLVEVLIVVGIISLLATIAIPNLLQPTRRARASEAVATMTMIRQSLRDYIINNATFYDVAADDIDELPTTGVGVDVGITQYFSNSAFSVDGTSPSSARFSTPAAQDFIISVDGSASDADCTDDDCALNPGVVTDFRLEMDNTGRTFISYDTGNNWTSY